jgi:hypothetical protein
MTGKTFNSNTYITIIKIIAILYVAILFGIFGLGLIYCTDNYVLRYIFPYNDSDSVPFLALQISLIVGILGSLSYLGRNIVQLIPFPLNGWHGFEYMRVKEVANGTILAIFIFGFSLVLYNKAYQLKQRIANVNKTNSSLPYFVF